MSFEAIIFDKSNNVSFVILNRPTQMNSLSTLLLEDLDKAIDEAEQDKMTRVMIITGKGKSFCAGADISDFEKFSSGSAGTDFLRKAQVVFTRLERMSIPVIAAVNGLALGGGCELALACDLRIASENAMFGVPEMKIGFIPGAGGTQRLPRTVGITKALEMLFTGDPISPDEAYRIGMVNKVVPADSLIEECVKMAEVFVKRPALALKMAKIAAINGLNMDIESGLWLELQCAGFLFTTEDQKEGMKAFLEKREPRFKGQ